MSSQQAPTTDRDLNIIIDHDHKFSDIRHKAIEDYIQRKNNRKKGKKAEVPKYKIGSRLIISPYGYRNKDKKYILGEIIDFEESFIGTRDDPFKYYLIVKKVTDEKFLNRIGRLIVTERSIFSSPVEFCDNPEVEEKIKWLNIPKIKRCPDCHAEEGELHIIGCDHERCPFCLGQLISCSCWYKKLGYKYNIHDDFCGLPEEIYNNGLSKEDENKFIKILEEKGRVPYKEE